MQRNKSNLVAERRTATALAKHSARRRLKLPVIHSDNEVALRGERLAKLLWQGRQWAVTAYGLECRDGTYAIRKTRLWEGDTHTWEIHMAEKNWVDIEDFSTAINWARAYFSGIKRKKSAGLRRSDPVCEVASKPKRSGAKPGLDPRPTSPIVKALVQPPSALIPGTEDWPPELLAML